MTKCPKCKSELPKKAKECKNCGYTLVAEEPPSKKNKTLKLIPISKLKNIFKSDSSDDDETDKEVIKPEVETIPLIGEAVALCLPVPQECDVCHGEIEAGKVFIRCYCELITHVACVSENQLCPQCGKELDLEFILPDAEKGQVGPKKPVIRREIKREIQELVPPTTSVFAHIPEITEEKKVRKFIRSYYDNFEIGKTTQNKNASDIDMFITVKAAKKMLDHCYEYGRKKEVMGLILGETYQHDDKLFSIAKDVATSDLDATMINVRFKNFEKLFHHLDKVTFDYQIIGWYHSHPGHSCFMSSIDVDTQHRMFKHSHQCAIVIDPINFDMKAFALDLKGKDEVKESGFAIINSKD